MIELMVVTTILGVVMAIASLGIDSLLVPQKRDRAASELQSALALARVEAIKRGVRVTVCGSANQTACAGSTSWNSGWIVFAESDAAGSVGTVNTNDTILRVANSVAGDGIALTASVNFFTFGSAGLLSSPTSGFPVTVDVCRSGHPQIRLATNISGLSSRVLTGTSC